MIRKTAIIIGASSDIGKEIAMELAEEGYNLALTYNKNVCEIKTKKDVKIQYYKLNLLNTQEIENTYYLCI